MRSATDRSDIPLAIIGMACRLPGAENLDQYWRLISEGRSAVGEVPPDRLDQALYFDPTKGTRGKTYSKKAALLANRQFDAARCPLPPELQRRVDNTHLLMCGVAADALRQARLDPFNLPIRNAGVFIGHAQGSSLLGELTYRAYLEEAIALLDEVEGLSQLPAPERQAIQQQLADSIRGRLVKDCAHVRDLQCNMVSGLIAKAFGLTGPWLALNSACASSLHAMLMGARALQLGRADMVIVGGASDCKSDSLVLFSHAQAMSTNDSRPFDADADGLIMSEGYVALVMKTLERAIADGDPIQAVVRGLGLSSDGKGKSLWAPRKEGQIKAMQRAYRSGVDIAGLQYLEAHATATQLGDATELNTLGEVLKPHFPPGKRIPITSVKANIGHALEAAGVAGVIKAVLCMQHRTYPAAINVRSLNPKIDWDSAPYFVPTKPAPWDAPADGGPRRAAVNGFGIGGLNMHVVLDEFTPGAALPARPPQVVPAATADDRAVAIIGMGCILPGATGLDQFWKALVERRDPKTKPNEQRWTRKALAEQDARSQPTVGGFISDYEYDWRKHKVPPKQVAEADPLQFMLLDAVGQALGDAGYDRKPLEPERSGVVVGTEFGGDFCDHLQMGLRLPEMQATLRELLLRRGVPADQIDTINSKFSETLLRKWPSLVDESGSFTSSTLASRITKTLDLAGGAVAIDSGSTSAMSGLAVCIDMLLSGDNDLMICAAGQRRMGPNAFESLDMGGLLAKDSPRSVFDAKYDGVVPAEGVAVVVLKRLADARRDGDRIHAVIRGLGIAHHDAPAEALRLAAQQALSVEGVHPDEVALAELDTDERLSGAGDELRTLAALHAGQRRTQPVMAGSVTSQFGHLGGGSGMVALIKAAMEIERGELPVGMRLEQPATALGALADTLQPTLQATRLAPDGRRLGALACWSNGQACYLVLEHGAPVAATPTLQAKPVAAPVMVPASATAPSGTWRICRYGASSQGQLLGELEAAERDIVSAWHAADVRHFSLDNRFRLAVVCDSPEMLARKLRLARSQMNQPAARSVLEQQGIFWNETRATRPRVAFVFPGQGSQYDGMLRELVRDVPAAAKALEGVDATMRRLGYPTFAELAWNTPTKLGQDVWTTQISMLLADAMVLATLRSIGIQPDLVLGHSYGEFPALFAAGAYDLETAIRLTRARCDGIAAVAGSDSGMLATEASPQKIQELSGKLGLQVFVANVNAPDQTVVGGRRDQLAALVTALTGASHQARMLSVPAAFHTPLMAGASRQLEQLLSTAAIQPPQTPVVSTVTNAPVGDAADIRRNLGSQLTTPVLYSQLIAQLAHERDTVFVEVGPQQTLTRLNRRIVDAHASVIAADNPKRPGVEPLLCVQAALECLAASGGATAAQTGPAVINTAATRQPAARPTSKSVVSQASGKKATSSSNTMEDQIPHFDATERRRTKMRGAHEGAPSPTAAPAAKKPVGPATKTAAPPMRPQLSPSDRGIAPPPKLARPTASPPPAYSNGDYANGEHRNGDHTSGELNGNGSAPPAAAPAPKPAVPEPTPAPAPAPVAKQIAPAELESFLVNFVVEQTGYPAEVVDLDADLEADLGIDSIKKAQLFGELQEYFDVGTSAGDLSLDDFPTLRHVLNFLAQANGAPSSPPAAPPAQAPQPAPVAQPIAAAPAPAPAAASNPVPTTKQVAPAELESFLVNFVVEQTGYPAEVVDLDADLEADLGIDSIKKAQLFGELQEYFDVGTSASNLSLDDFPTLRHVLNFLAQSGGASNSATAPAAAPPVAASAPVARAPTEPPVQESVAATPSATPPPAELESFLVNFVVEQTGYPAEVVDLDADLEADLGIDSIKKAQLFGELQEYFDVGTSASNLSLDDFPTLRHVLNFLSSSGGVSGSGSTAPSAPALASDPAPVSPRTTPVDAQRAFSMTEPSAMATPVAAPPQPADRTAPQPAELESFLINFVVEQTGYPAEVVDLDADLEADLGIDSIKKAQLFGELQEYFDVGTSASNLSLDDFPTLRHVLNFLIQAGGAAGTASAAPVAPQEAKGAAGTPYEIGFELGLVRKQEILRTLRERAQRFVDGLNPPQDSVGNFSADELDALQGIADAVEVPLGNLRSVAREQAMFGLSLPATRGTSAAPETTVPDLSSSSVTRRFSLEMREAPLAAAANQPRWNGAAVILGTSRAAAALRQQLLADGVTVHDLSSTGDLDSVVARLEQICRAAPAPHLFVALEDAGLAPHQLSDADWLRRRQEALVLPFFVCQKWVQLAAEGQWLAQSTLVALTAQGGDFGLTAGSQLPEAGAVAGLLKAIFIEFTVMQGGAGPRVKVIDAADDVTPAAIVNGVLRELASRDMAYEVAFKKGRRWVPYAVQREAQPSSATAIRTGSTWVVTGGARGISAACALELAKRYQLKLHLIGASPAPDLDPTWRNLTEEGLQQLKARLMIEARQRGQSAAQAWERTQKDLEIDRSLRAFAAAGVAATYHACDVSDRAALAETLNKIRQTDGPIEGILHGAGIDRSCRFAKKDRAVVLATIGAKVEGAVNLMALTRRDPVRHFIGFGSISGRLGSFGQTDYCLASDMLCKLIGTYRRERPWIQAVGFHWHPWDEVGMAARPETKSVLQTTSDLRLMPLAEGITHLVRELAAGVPDAEVLITERRHWDRFAAGLGKLVEPQAAPSTPATTQSAPASNVELHTHRCVLRTLDAPLPAGSPAAPTFESAVWILGNNPVADALERRLAGQGVTVQRLPTTGNPDQTLAAMDQLWEFQPAKHLFVLTGRDAVTGTLQNADTMRQRRDAGILLPFFATQRWYKLLTGRADLGAGTFVAAVSLGGNFGFDGHAESPEGGALAGMGKALCIEDSRRERSVVRGKVIDAPANESPEQLVDAMLRELASAEPEVEVSWSAGARRVIRPLPAAQIKDIAAPSCEGGTWIVTGGARGITAIAARELARRHGWTLHLLGKSPPPLTDAPWRNYSAEEMRSFKTNLSRQAVAEGRSPSEAWDRVMKDVEIHRNLQQFAEAGVKATYHECDITNRDTMAATLAAIRRTDGPIRGVLHGAGLIDPGRFENKRRDFVISLVNAKFCGTLNLMALTQSDPLAFFVGFGSISGRFGGNGLADYAAGNDAMAKTIDWFRAARPDCASTCIHWESWEGSGMATLPRFAWGPKAIMKMKYMTPEEGVERLDQELRAGLPESEVLYTFGDFYPMFYPHEQRPLGPFTPGQLAAPSEADSSLPLLKSVRKDGEGFIGDATFDPTAEAFLKQHLLRGKPLLPVVVGLEALAEVAQAATQKQVVGFLNVQMLDGLSFHTDRAATAQARAALAADGTVDAQLTCDFRNRAGGLIQKDRPYLRASVDVAASPIPWKADLPGKPAASQWTNFSYPDDAMVYHGPAFRGLNGTCFDRQGGWGRIAALPLADMVGAERASQWRIPSCVLDAALYACGCHLWVHGERAISLPKQIEQLRIGKAPREGETCLVHFTCREITADAAVYDFDVVDESGAVVLKARGYRKVILARGEATPGETR